MGFRPSLRTTSDGVTREASFLASEHMMVKRIGVTLDSGAFGAADGDGNIVVKAGTVLGAITASGKYGPYDAAVDPADGTETAVGFLLETVNLRHGDVVTGLMLHGSVLRARVTGLDAGAEADMAGRIVFQ